MLGQLWKSRLLKINALENISILTFYVNFHHWINDLIKHATNTILFITIIMFPTNNQFKSYNSN